MVSPNLIRKNESETPLELNENAKKLFQVIYSEKNKKETGEEEGLKIKVSSLVSALAFVYEKVRNAVDYEEEHLLRKNAMARILRRQVVIEGVIKETHSVDSARQLLQELIRGSYLPNNKLPETKIGEIAAILEKYLYLKNQLAAKINADLNLKADINRVRDLIKGKNQLIRWLFKLAACEIEENLAPNRVKQVIVNNMFAVLTANIKLPEDLPRERDLDIQIYLSIARTFLKFDPDMLSFVLFKYYNGEWLEFSRHLGLKEAERGKIKELSSHLEELKGEIDRQLNHPLKKQLDKITRLYSLYFMILADTVETDPVKVYNDLQSGERAFAAVVKSVCRARYRKAKVRLWRAAVRSIIYIFLTKSIFAVLIEIPAIQWFNQNLNYLSLAINVSFPALLLFFIVALTPTPQEDNTNKIIAGIKEITFVGSARKQPLILRRPPRRNFIKTAIFQLIYAAAFCVSIYFIIRVLTFIHFNWVSIIIFLFFLALVSFFSVIVTKGVKELMVLERHENLLTFLIDLFYMPIIFVGRWLSNNVSKINVFIFVFDFIIEAPFKIVIEVAEDWTKYVRERRERIES